MAFRNLALAIGIVLGLAGAASGAASAASASPASPVSRAAPVAPGISGTPPGPTLAVRGRVVDSEGHPVARAAVLVAPQGRVVIADGKGEFRIDLPPGAYRLEAERLGFERGVVDIYVHPLSAPQPVLRLVARPFRTAPVVVNAPRRTEPDPVLRPGERELGPAELQRQVGGFEDVMRSVQAQPGVGASSDLQGEFTVHGSAATANSITLDGVEIPFPYHILGFNSVFNPGLLESATLWTSGAPAELGNATGGFLTLQSRGASPSAERGAVGLSYLSAQARLSLGDARRGVFVSLRRSHQDQLLRLVGSSLGRMVPVFHDFFARARWQPSEGHLVTVGLLNAADGMSLPQPEVQAGDFLSASSPGAASALARNASNRDRLGLTNDMWVGTMYWRAGLGPTAVLETTLGHVPQEFEFSLQGDSNEWVSIRGRRTSLRQDLTWRPERHHAKFGWLVSRDDAVRRISAWAGILTLRESNSAINLVDLKERYEIDAARRRDLWSLYAQDEWQASDRLFLCGGLRTDRDGWARETLLSPRLAAEWRVTPHWKTRATLGLYHDFRDEPMEVLPTVDGTPLRAERSLEATLGGSLAWSPQLQGGGSAFFKRLDRLVYEAKPSLYASGGVGNVAGFETWLRWEPRHLPIHASLTYTWSRTRQRDPVAWRRQPNYWAVDVDEFWSVQYENPYTYRPAQDEPHRLGLQGSIRRGPWDFGLRYQLASGRPYTPVEWVATDPLETRYGIVGAKGSARYPVYQRLDVRVMRTMQRGRVRYSIYADVLNATAAENVFQYRYDSDYRVRYAVKMLPLLPTLGIEASF